MSFYLKLKQKMAKKLSKNELEQLPRSYQIIGKILLLKLKPSLYSKRKAIGRAVLELLPYVHSVFLQKGIVDIERKPEIELLAGCRETQTLHREHGCRFLLDVGKIMWSKGNKQEKLRMIKLVKPGETMVDMFAGVGYWSILVAKHTKASKIYAIDISPAAIKYLEKNVWLNQVQDEIEILKGDCRDFAGPLKNIADRVIMGYFPASKLLPAAMRMAKKGAVIHYHDTMKAEELGKLRKELRSRGLKVKKTTIVKTYAPNILHVVLDLQNP